MLEPGLPTIPAGDAGYVKGAIAYSRAPYRLINRSQAKWEARSQSAGV
jgi:hypothetical protein